MKTKSVYSYLCIFFLIAFFQACIKDTDFSQAEDVVLNPVVELDLISFNLPAITFFDTITATPILTVRDTTELAFLNDEGVQRDLKKAEFYFKVTNSIQRDFHVVFKFLNEQNGTMYTSQFPVSQGAVSNPVITEYIDIVEDSIRGLTMAEKVAVSVTIPSFNENLDGTLKLESKITYYLEF